MTRSLILIVAGVSAMVITTAPQAADLIIEAPAPMPVIEDSGSWDGPYVGVFTGYGMGQVYDEFGAFDLDGEWIGGFVLGADFTVGDNIVVGIAGDVTYLGLEGIDPTVPFNVDYNLHWGASLRGKVGFDAGAFLPYLTAGVALGQATVEGSGVILGSDENTHVGYTVGAGVEFKVTDNASIDLLYKYTDYGRQEYLMDNSIVDVGFTTHTVTAGLNWRF